MFETLINKENEIEDKLEGLKKQIEEKESLNIKELYNDIKKLDIENDQHKMHE